MSDSVPLDVQCFDVETGLSKALGKKVETFLVDVKSGIFKFRIGYRWNLCVDEYQLGTLWDAWENISILKDKFNALKGECLAFQSYK